MVSGIITVFSVADLYLPYLVLLLIVHFIADFYLQKDGWITDRNEKVWKSYYLYCNAGIVGILSFIVSILYLSISASLIITAFIFVSHFLIDGFKASYCLKKTKSENNNPENSESDNNDICNNEINLFIADQALHLIIIFSIWFIITFNTILKIIALQLNSNILLPGLIILVGYIVILKPSGYFIQFFTNPWTKEILELEKKKKYESLEKAGRYIGFLERFLIYTLVLFQQYLIIGFIVTAKSILRYSKKRKIGEYVLLGTFLSFSVSISMGIVVRLALCMLGFDL